MAEVGTVRLTWSIVCYAGFRGHDLQDWQLLVLLKSHFADSEEAVTNFRLV
jgi:hypothetical protein